MLDSISIQNYALIDQLDIDLSTGLNVITGETGAGKSIIINALSLLLGNRASKDNIRKDKNKMIVSGQFSLADDSVARKLLSDKGIDSEEEIVISREVDRNGRNVCRINGQIVSLSLFRELGNHLIDIHSQHEHVALFKPEHQRELLDLFGGPDLIETQSQVRELAVKLRDLAKKIKELQLSTKEANRNHAINQFQLEEIRNAGLEKNEEEELLEKEKELQKQEKLFEQSYQAVKLLDSEDDQQSINSLLTELSDQIDNLAQIDSSFENYKKSLDNIVNEFNSLSFDLSDYFNRLDFEPQSLSRVESRLNEINKLKSKYGETIEEVLNYADELEEKINLFDNADFLLEESKNTYKNVRKDYNLKARELSELRLKAAQNLKGELEAELKDLAMDKARVEIEVSTDKDLISLNGQDGINFLISVNPGLEPKALKQVASGGEISRIMLAIKGIFGEKDQIETLIFDEIDTGISGRTAQVVAEKIVRLASKRQIICITHLPQIAAMADHQFLVQKQSDQDSTAVNFTQLDEPGRAQELARMLGGAEVTEVTMENAQEMLKQAALLKQNL